LQGARHGVSAAVVLVLHHTIGGQVVSRHIEAFTCSVIPDRDHVVVAPRGELDMATVGVVDKELRGLREAGFKHLVLDLSGLTFMDSSGLNLVSRWTAEASKGGFEFELEAGSPLIERVFELSGLTDSLRYRNRS
jgi:anti-sigma B factor antagonist